MDALEAALDLLLADPVLARDALYRPGDAGTGTSVRVIVQLADRVGSFGETRIASDTALFDLRVSEVVAPRAGDSLELGSVRYLIQGEPLRDAERLVWIIEARPA